MSIFKTAMRYAACFLAVWLTTLIFGEKAVGSLPAVAGAAALLWLANFTIRPILKLLSLPVGCLTFGISGLLIDALMVWIAVRLIPGISFSGFWPYLFAAVLASIATGLLAPKDKKH